MGVHACVTCTDESRNAQLPCLETVDHGTSRVHMHLPPLQTAALVEEGWGAVKGRSDSVSALTWVMQRAAA